MQVPEYIECELNLTNYDQAELRVGNLAYPGRSGLTPEFIKDKLLEVSLDQQQYGKLLFEALLPAGSDLLTGYVKAVAFAVRDEKRLRFRLRIAITAPGDLQALYWERLYDPTERLALSRARDVVFSRYLSVDKEIPKSLEIRVPKMLVVISGPTNLAEYELAEIQKDQTTALLRRALSQLRNQVQYEFLDGPATPARIADKLVGSDFHALHIYAHGITKGEGQKKTYLVLEDEEGKAKYADENVFTEILEGAHSLRLITLIACRSGVQVRDDPFSGMGQALVRMGFPAVIAMQQEVSTETAEVFTEYFYRNLARTGQVDVAANAARRQILLSDPETSDWSNPVLFMRLSDGNLWTSVVDAEDEQSPSPEITPGESFNWQPLLEWLPQGQVIPIIGPEINLGLLPSHGEITERWAKEFNYEKYNYPLNDRNDLPRVAQFVETMSNSQKFPHMRLLNIFKEGLLKQEKVEQRNKLTQLNLSEIIAKIAQQHFDRDKNDPYEILAKLPVSNYLTTNPDSFMEEALKFEKKTPQKESALWQEDDDDTGNERYKNLRGTPTDPVVFHLYGANAASLVLTEDDHLDFLRFMSKDSWRIPRFLKQDLTESVWLFLGYNIRNLDFRVAFKGLIAQLKKPAPGRIAILQIQPEKDFQQQIQDLRLLQNFMEKDCANLKLQVYWGSVRKFLIRLWQESNK